MKKRFLLSKPAPKTAETSSTTQVTPTSVLKSIPSDRFHDVIVDFLALHIGTIVPLFGSLTPSTRGALGNYLYKHRDQIIPLELLAQRFDNVGSSHLIAHFLATLFNVFLSDDEHREIFLMDSEIHRALDIASKQTPDMENLGDPMHQSDTSMNFDVFDTNSIGSLDDVEDELLATPPRNVTPIPVTPLTKSQKRNAKKKARSLDNVDDELLATPPCNITPIPVTPLTKFQKQSAKKKACKEKQKLQLQTPSGLDEHVVSTFSKEFPEYTPSKPSGSRMVTFNQSLLSPPSPPSTPYKVHKKYLSARVRLIPDYECLKCYNGGDWTVNLEGIPVRWFPASWNLSERKQRENGIKAFKIVKEVDGSRKLIGYFDTWDRVSTRINNPQLWNDVRISWCRYSTPNFKNLRKSAQIGNAEKSFETPKGSNFSFSGFNTNNRKNDQYKTPKSRCSTKKIDQSRNDQFKKPDVKHLIAGLKALLEHYV
ncbi:hypothetical protein RclHR1_01340006 [Rhizophagus clarus]|uniref:Uncharacterized protein n=1 Tax=Rhizophagus clarus TaxID=94130 RepID=A0A2Z6QM89_9GLOM|nr:hypothetical protein RclHR1_01340006 [Rhizophagus clarus]